MLAITSLLLFGHILLSLEFYKRRFAQNPFVDFIHNLHFIIQVFIKISMFMKIIIIIMIIIIMMMIIIIIIIII